MTVTIIGPKDLWCPQTKGTMVNTTSRSRGWSRGLSPFFVGPIPLYEGAVVPESRNMENAWQASKVYEEYMGKDGNPSRRYFEWARRIWLDTKAHRYPAGKNRAPMYSWWAGKKLGYVEARRAIYIPLYARAVAQTTAFCQLARLYLEHGEVTLWDFDGYNYRARGKTLQGATYDPRHKMGHAFVLAILLERMKELGRLEEWA